MKFTANGVIYRTSDEPMDEATKAAIAAQQRTNEIAKVVVPLIVWAIVGAGIALSVHFVGFQITCLVMLALILGSLQHVRTAFDDPKEPPKPEEPKQVTLT